ncbi:MAG: hypothetical protein UHD09_05500 [Bifidobacterium sp.]|nr:hypothetical protein [Bifidobacterium sp.]
MTRVSSGTCANASAMSGSSPPRQHSSKGMPRAASTRRPSMNSGSSARPRGSLSVCSGSRTPSAMTGMRM